VLKFRLLAAVDSVVSCCAQGRIKELGVQVSGWCVKISLLAAVDSVVSCCAHDRIKELSVQVSKWCVKTSLACCCGFCGLLLCSWQDQGTGCTSKRVVC